MSADNDLLPGLWRGGTPDGRDRSNDQQANSRRKALKPEFNLRLTGWLLAGLALISAEAHADNGFTVTTSRENVIAIGMSTSEVRQLLGRPASAVRYRNTPGPVWTYKVVDPLFGRTEFNIEFGADERVMAKGEVVLGSESPNAGRRD
jgi:hypothetical protein